MSDRAEEIAKMVCDRAVLLNGGCGMLAIQTWDTLDELQRTQWLRLIEQVMQLEGDFW